MAAQQYQGRDRRFPRAPPHVVRYALNSGPGLNIPAWAVYIALAHFSDERGLSERTHREIADAIDAGSVSTVKAAPSASRVLRQGGGHPAPWIHRGQEPPQRLPDNRRGIRLGADSQGTPGTGPDLRSLPSPPRGDRGRTSPKLRGTRAEPPPTGGRTCCGASTNSRPP